jgi:predicted phage terminase large subunit-like protein
MTRLNDPDKSAIIVVMQRLHEQDLTGLYLQDKGWDYLCLPMCFEEDRVRSSIGFRDPRNKPNELLWAERFPKSTIAEYRKPPYSSYFFAAQLQQRPAPVEGGMIKREWLKTYKELPHVKRWSWSWDTAIKTGQTNDYSVGGLWAECENGYYLVKVWRDRVEYPELRRQVKMLFDRHRTSEVIIEDKASGQQVLQDFQRIGSMPVIAVSPGKDMPNSKQERLLLVSSLFEAGKIYLPEMDHWVADYVEEIAQFPNAMYDDQVDMTTQYLARRLTKREPRIINL